MLRPSAQTGNLQPCVKIPGVVYKPLIYHFHWQSTMVKLKGYKILPRGGHLSLLKNHTCTPMRKPRGSKYWKLESVLLLHNDIGFIGFHRVLLFPLLVTTGLSRLSRNMAEKVLRKQNSKFQIRFLSTKSGITCLINYAIFNSRVGRYKKASNSYCLYQPRSRPFCMYLFNLVIAFVIVLCAMK